MPALAVIVGIFILQFSPNILIALLGGTIGTALYLGFFSATLKEPKNPFSALTLLLDGPFWLILTILFGTAPLLGIISFSLSEITAVIFGVIATTILHAPTSSDKKTTLALLGPVGIGMTVLCISYAAQLPSHIASLLFVGSCLQGSVAVYATQQAFSKQSSRERPYEAFLIIGILAWISAWMIFGPISWLFLHKP